MNCFMLWTHRRRPELAAEYPHLPNTEVSTLLGHEWKEMSEAEKDKFRKLAQEVKNEHAKLYPEYK
jgi:HMG box factor